MSPTATAPALDKKRIIWIDWMKSIGIYLIVAGHFFPIGERYVYGFSVPLFFLVSGFLSKREPDSRIFWKKLWYNMVIPLASLCLIIFTAEECAKIYEGNFSLSDIPKFLVGFIGGFHFSLQCLWYVYTLICLKIILQYMAKGRTMNILLLIALPMAGIWLNRVFPSVFGFRIVRAYNAAIDTTIAYPFYIIGFYLKKWKSVITGYRNIPVEIICFAIFAFILIFSVMYNGDDRVSIVRCCYGDNFILYLTGGLSGSICVLIISKFLGDTLSGFATTISRGTIIILAFHIYLIPYIKPLISDCNPFVEYLAALLLTISFVPLIMLISRYAPFLIGNRGNKST
ncbi:MAG: acyltransferase family protein [Duncaniella sp.]|nr:acyltransferase family protein [Duncaniella sp.]